MKPQLHIALALIWREGEVLVARRRADAEHLPGCWEFPGGKVELGETPAAACLREAREEIGMEIEITGARAIITWDYLERTVTLHPFDCRIVSGQARALESAEIAWRAPLELEASHFPAANAGLIARLRASDGS